MTEPTIHVAHVHKQFAAPLSWSQMLSFPRPVPLMVTALNDVTCTVNPGRTLGLLGPNGAGKTTFLKIISTLILPDQGSVRVKGYDITRNEQRVKAYIGLVSSEERSFYWRLTGRQNLEFFAAMQGLTPAAARKRIQELLTLFSITYADKRFDSYSAGMKRALALARALLHAPEIILLDEPTKSLDYNTAAMLRSHLRALRQENKTILLATHDMEEAAQACDEFIILHRGAVCGRGTLDTLRQAANMPAASLSSIYLRLTDYAQ